MNNNTDSTHVNEFLNWLPNATSQGATLDTKDLQMMSLMNYMGELGYDMIGQFDPDDWNCTHFEYIGDGIKTIKFKNGSTWRVHIKGDMPSFLSFDDAVRLHNGNYKYRLLGFKLVNIMTLNITLSFDTWCKASDSKLIKQVKLQRKKGGAIIVQNHLVKLMSKYKYTK